MKRKKHPETLETTNSVFHYWFRQYYFTIKQPHSKIKNMVLMWSEKLETALKPFVMISHMQNFEPQK